MKYLIPGFLVAILFIFSCCQQPAKNNESTSQSVQRPVEWSKNANIYEVNIRQYTNEGTFKAFEAHMPRLKEMGVDILWIMPINPISEKNRKGSLGSYYAVKDYQEINPEFGTKEDFKHLVDYAHELGMKLIIDWVANHTGWDNHLITEHPDWYKQDSAGNIISPVADWTDVAGLNYESQAMREYMIESMEYWVRNFDIDGYRCDVAGMVPVDFWVDARLRLDSLKPVFMLAEWDTPEMHKAFDMTYGWEFHHIINKIAKGELSTSAIGEFKHKFDSLYQPNDYKMMFTSNHDENSWNGTEFERMGELADAMFVIAATFPGMPLIYTGQEDALNRRLLFFEKDPVQWGEYSKASFFKKLLMLKKENPALWNGMEGGNWKEITEGIESGVFAFMRQKEDKAVVVYINLTKDSKIISLPDSFFNGKYISLYTEKEIAIPNKETITLEPWGFEVLAK